MREVGGGKKKVREEGTITQSGGLLHKPRTRVITPLKPTGGLTAWQVTLCSTWSGKCVCVFVFMTYKEKKCRVCALERERVWVSCVCE